MRAIDGDSLAKKVERAYKFAAGDRRTALSYVLDLIADAPTITPSNEWINMDDMPPEFPNFLDHIMVITCNKNDYVIPMVRERTLVGYEWVERWLYPWNKIYDGPEITYWTSLPKPPGGELRNETNRC